jgi:hypothetical protein
LHPLVQGCRHHHQVINLSFHFLDCHHSQARVARH